ncbi:MAG: N-acetyltransferase [Alphaproteobacteria bacterium]|nr:MAG: N-acetyltransferase [Alphaproteobacteria bacterium]
MPSPRLMLRAPRRSDAGLIRLYAGDPRVARMTESIPSPYPPGAAEDFIDGLASGRRSDHVWIMDGTPCGAAELIGAISAQPAGEAAFRLGYWVGPPFWNTGYASEALASLIPVLFEAGVERLEARVFVDNPASAHIVARAGFVAGRRVEVYSVARGEMVPARAFTLERADAPAPG